MRWDLDNIRFLHPPDDFTGSFTNEKMQQRHKEMQELKIKDLLSNLEQEEHPVKAMEYLHQKEHITFVINNINLFKSTDCYEEAVLNLYYRKNTPFAAAGVYDTWKQLFEGCDEEKIYNLGSPLPQAKNTAYRGSVTGISKGFSWTLEKKEVAWILGRWQDKDLGGGTVFSIEVTKEDILVYLEIEKGNRKEVILKPDLVESLKPTKVENIE